MVSVYTLPSSSVTFISIVDVALEAVVENKCVVELILKFGLSVDW